MNLENEKVVVSLPTLDVPGVSKNVIVRIGVGKLELAQELELVLPGGAEFKCIVCSHHDQLVDYVTREAWEIAMQAALRGRKQDRTTEYDLYKQQREGPVTRFDTPSVPPSADR